MKKTILLLVTASCAFVIALMLFLPHGQETTISVLLDEGTDVQKVEESIRNVEGVSAVEFISKDSELDYFLDTLSESEQELLTFEVSANGNPMKDRVDINVKGSVDHKDVIAAVSSFEGIAEVLYYE